MPNEEKVEPKEEKKSICEGCEHSLIMNGVDFKKTICLLFQQEVPIINDCNAYQEKDDGREPEEAPEPEGRLPVNVQFTDRKARVRRSQKEMFRQKYNPRPKLIGDGV